MFPNPILQQIFTYLSLQDKLKASRVSRRWHYNCMDPHLYQHVEFKNLEFHALIQAMQFIVQINPLLQSISITGCYSDFIRNTVVPVQCMDNQPPLLYSHIHALEPNRRRQEYLKHGFDLHHQFSTRFTQLLQLSRGTLTSLKITHCTLDFEMTELFCAVACHGASLQTFWFLENGDRGLASSGLLQAIVSGSPRMRHFLGLHAGMNDAVVMMMARHWPYLESLTLHSMKSKALDSFISSDAFWALIENCVHMRQLEVHDLACFTNRDLACQKNKKRDIGLRYLKVTKYITTPLSTPGFQDLVQVFPHLQQFEYVTNFDTFYHQFEGVTLDMYEAERVSVAQLMAQKSFKYQGYWYEPITTEQRLMAGMAIRSYHYSHAYQ